MSAFKTQDSFDYTYVKKDQQSEHQGDEEVITKRRTKEEGFTYNQKLDRIDTSIIYNYLHYQCRLF